VEKRIAMVKTMVKLWSLYLDFKKTSARVVCTRFKFLEPKIFSWVQGWCTRFKFLELKIFSWVQGWCTNFKFLEPKIFCELFVMAQSKKLFAQKTYQLGEGRALTQALQ
jgi:hypothetical protein